MEEEGKEILFTKDCKIGKGPFKRNGRLTLTERRVLLEEDSTPIAGFGGRSHKVVMDLPITDLGDISEKRKSIFGGSEIKITVGDKMTILSFDGNGDGALESLKLCMEIEKKKRIFWDHKK